MAQVPLDSDGVCMLCKEKPSEETALRCTACATPTLSSGDGLGGAPAPADSEMQEVFAAIGEIEEDSGLSERGKKIRREKGESSGAKNDFSFDNFATFIGQSIKCAHCMEVLKQGRNSRKRGRESCIIRINGTGNTKQLENPKKRSMHLQLKGDDDSSDEERGE